jgi:hypothetical protein
MSPLGLAIPPRCLADVGHSLPEWGAARRPFPPLATELRTPLVVRFVPEGDIGSATSSRINELHPLWPPSQ